MFGIFLMKPKTIKITYWVLTIVFCLFFIADGLASALHEKSGVAIFTALGYPLYVMTITGVAKLIGSAVLLQNRYTIIKEWAFAGFTIDFLGAAFSSASAGIGAAAVISPLIFLAVTFGVYYFWKRNAANRAVTSMQTV